MSGVPTLQYPTPLHYETIPDVIRKNKITIFFQCRHFLSNYGKRAKANDFVGLRLVFAGAEKLKSPTRQLWRKKFNIEIMEGYALPKRRRVISFNTPQQNKPGSVGKALPGIKTRLLPEEGIGKGGRLVISGPNVMLGYYKAKSRMCWRRRRTAGMTPATSPTLMKKDISRYWDVPNVLSK